MRKPPTVAVVSNNPETLDGLTEYFERTGIASYSTRAIREIGEGTSPAARTVAVVFPDDFDERDVLEVLRQLRRRRVGHLVLLITRDPERYRSFAIGAGTPHVTIVLPRPSFGWEIVDVIRAHMVGRDTG